VQPEIQRYFLDTWANALDFPGSEDLAARFKTLVPKEALAASEQQDPRNQLVMMQSQLAEATQALQVLQQQLEQSKQTETVATQQVALLEKAMADLKVRLDNKAQELQVDAQKAQWQFQVDQEKNAIDWRELELKYALGQPNGALLPQNGNGNGNGQEDTDAD
jgi:chromosome segregation ATPase